MKYRLITVRLITLENVPEEEVVKISDISGKTINISETINGTTRLLNISALNNGMYIISVHGNSQTIIKE